MLYTGIITGLMSFIIAVYETDNVLLGIILGIIGGAFVGLCNAFTLGLVVGGPIGAMIGKIKCNSLGYEIEKENNVITRLSNLKKK